MHAEQWSIFELELVGRGELTPCRPGRTGAPQPDGDRPALPSVAAVGNIIGQLGFAAGFSELAFQPERLGAGQPQRGDRLRITGPVGVADALIEALPGPGFARIVPSRCSVQSRMPGDGPPLRSSS